MARKFFYVCAGMLMLALSYHLGGSVATAQAPASPVIGFSASGGAVYAMTQNGDVFWHGGPPNITPLEYLGNFWSGGPTTTRQESWGQLKSRYAPNRGTAKPGADNR